MARPSEIEPTNRHTRHASPPNGVTPVFEPTIAHLTAWIDAERTFADESRRRRLASDYAALRHEFSELTEETRRLSIDGRLDGGEAAVLRRLFDRALAISQLIDSELARVSAADQIVSPYVIGELIELCGELLERVQSQLRLIGTFEQYADDLRQIVSSLLFNKHVSPARLQNLARRIVLEVGESSPERLLLPAPGLVVDEFLQRADDARRAGDVSLLLRRSQTESAVYAAGIQTARLLAFAADRTFDWTDRRELLTTAALLQDVGLLLLETRYDRTPRQLASEEPAVYRRHPLIGAAVAGALTGYAVDLPFLIAQHHERCDGIGYPRGLRAEHLSAPARFLAIANRFVELTLRDGETQIPEISENPRDLDRESGKTMQSIGNLYEAAARTLRREAEQAEFDRLLTGRFLEALGFDGSDSLPESPSPAANRHFRLDRFGAKQFRRDHAHSRTVGQPSPPVGSAPETKSIRGTGGRSLLQSGGVPAPKFLRRAALERNAASSATAERKR